MHEGPNCTKKVFSNMPFGTVLDHFHAERCNRTKTFRLQRGTCPRSLRRIGFASFLLSSDRAILYLMRNVENFDMSFTLISSKINRNEMYLIKVDTETSWFPVTSGK